MQPAQSDTTTDGWTRQSEVDELTDKQIVYLISDQSNGDHSVFTQSTLKCVASSGFGDPPPDVELTLSTTVFDEQRNPLSLLWRMTSTNPLGNPLGGVDMPITETQVTVTRDGGQSFVGQQLLQQNFTNQVEQAFTYSYRSRRFSQSSGALTGDFRVQLTANNGRTVVVRMPVETSELFRAFVEHDCPHRPGAVVTDRQVTREASDSLMSLLFDNTVVARDADGHEWSRAYYNADHTFSVISQRSGNVDGSWTYDGKTLCVEITRSQGSGRKSSCQAFLMFRAIGDQISSTMNDGTVVTATLEAGRP